MNHAQLPFRHRTVEMLQRLIDDDSGVIWTMELVLVATVIVIGSIVGLATFRDAIVQEFGDLAAASASLDQSYRYSSTADAGTIGTVIFSYSVAGSGYSDESNFCEPDPKDPVNDAPMCIQITGTTDEGEALP